MVEEGERSGRIESITQIDKENERDVITFIVQLRA